MRAVVMLRDEPEAIARGEAHELETDTDALMVVMSRCRDFGQLDWHVRSCPVRTGRLSVGDRVMVAALFTAAFFALVAAVWWVS